MIDQFHDMADEPWRETAPGDRVIRPVKGSRPATKKSIESATIPTDQAATAESTTAFEKPVNSTVAERIGVRVLAASSPAIGTPADSIIAGNPQWYADMTQRREEMVQAGRIPTDAQLIQGIFQGTGAPFKEA